MRIANSVQAGMDRAAWHDVQANVFSQIGWDDRLDAALL
jgi:hypothetical protein